MNRLSIIIPVYNESSTLRAILERVLSVELVVGFERELVLINDCSTDDSERVALEFIKSHPAELIRYARHERNRGKGMSIRTGLGYVTGEYVVIQDADLEYDPNDYNVLLSYLLETGGRVVYGSRYLNHENRHSYSSFYVGGRLVSLVANVLYGQRLTDEPTCYKMLETGLLRSLGLRCERFEFCPEVTAKVSKLGYRIPELPVRYYPRSISEGKKIRWWDGLEALWVLIKYRFINITPRHSERGAKNRINVTPRHSERGAKNLIKGMV